jgi:hypothetical protein
MLPIRYERHDLCVNVLIAGPGSSKLGLRTTAAIIFGRLVLVPPVGLGIVMLADKLGFLPAGDKMFRFVLLLQHSMPTSVLAGKTQFSFLDTSLNKFLRKAQNLDRIYLFDFVFVSRDILNPNICRRLEIHTIDISL